MYASLIVLFSFSPSPPPLSRLADQGLQEGPAAAGEPAQVREMRGHVESDLPQRCFGPPQLEATLLRQAHLRKAPSSRRGDHSLLLVASSPLLSGNGEAFVSWLLFRVCLALFSRVFPPEWLLFTRPRAESRVLVAKNARTRPATSRGYSLPSSCFTSAMKNSPGCAKQFQTSTSDRDSPFIRRSFPFREDTFSNFPGISPPFCRTHGFPFFI